MSIIKETTQSTTSRRAVLGQGLALAAASMVAATAASANTQTPPDPEPRANTNGAFAGKVVLITGATSGIGEATAKAFAMRGARVFFCGRRENLGKKVEDEIHAAGGDATYMRADVREPGQVEAFVEACVARYGRVDIAFNNAGIETPTPAPLADQSIEDWKNVQDTNVMGVFYSLKYEIPHMLKQGGGIIINMGSVSSQVGFATIAPYNASKHAVSAMTKVAALEYSAKNIRINSILPGVVRTPMIERAMKGFNLTEPQLAAMFPNNRMVEPEEMARTVMWMASDDATALIGTDVDVTGGYLAK
jgi:NAD(P)-dependent dehydrogenase (short-subunit alcohol dehydrogenase family)